MALLQPPSDPPAELQDLHPDDPHATGEALPRYTEKQPTHDNSPWRQFLIFVRGLPCFSERPGSKPEPSSQLSTYVMAFLIFLVPSWMFGIPKLFKSAPPTPRKPRGPTAYMDGLRGIACLLVYIFHYGYWFWPFLGYGYGAEGSQNTIWQWTIVRLMHSGRPCVVIFFLISGYVITARPLSLIYKGQQERALEALSGAVFRRPLRLFIPVAVATCIMLIPVRFDWFLLFDIRKATFNEQFWHWWYQTLDTMDPHQLIDGRRKIHFNLYIDPLWTIPIEFRGSLMCYLMVLAFVPAKRWIHLLVSLANAYWLTTRMQLDLALFCIGMVLAEVALIMPPSATPSRFFRWGRQFGTLAICLVSLHLMSFPELGGTTSPGFMYLAPWTMSQYLGSDDDLQQYWISVGGILFFVALMYSPPTTMSWRLSFRRGSGRRGSIVPALGDDAEDGSPMHMDPALQPTAEPLLQRPFMTPFAQYMGWVSYSFYLVHKPVMMVIGWRFSDPAKELWEIHSAKAEAELIKGSMEEYRYWFNHRLWEYSKSATGGIILCTILIFWWADVFTRAVDQPTLNLTRWLWNSAKTKKG